MGLSSVATKKSVSVRVSPHAYLGAAFVLLFSASFLLYIDQYFFGAANILVAILVVPLLAFFDRIAFDGKRLIRTGLLPRLLASFGGFPNRLRLNHIEQVDTQAIRAFKRNGRVIYAYRTMVRGRGVTMSFATGGDKYIRLINEIFPLLPDDVLDTRSIELREFYINHKQALQNAKASNIPSADVLEEMIDQVRSGRGLLRPAEIIELNDAKERVSELRTLANQLRVNGALLQATEVFRRAIRIKPADGWLLFEFAKCLYSFGLSERDPRMERRAVAMLRLAEKRAGNDIELLSRLGESYFQIGDWQRAGAVFRRTIENVGESFRALRGLAELALREGKIAHVIHNFAAANRLAATNSLKRWTDGEVEYFSRLNADEEYMELEVSRVNLIDSLIRARGNALRVTGIGLPIIIAGVILQNELVANIGWAVSGVAIVAWVVMSVMERMLDSRIPLDMVESAD